MFHDLKDKQFNRLTVRKYHGKNNQSKSLWLCDCECGNTILVTTADLNRGHVKSCGCLQRDTVRKNMTTHGKSYSRLYTIWDSMKQRCYNENNVQYSNYGGRYIKICDEWLNSFEAFYNWSNNNGYKEHLTIDRVNNDGNYEPSNCRWATHKEQQNNRSNNHNVTYCGETHTIAEWSEILNIPYHKVLKHLEVQND